MPIAAYVSFVYGRKKGLNDFMEIFLKFGYETKVKAFIELNHFANEGGIVFVGDSITQDYNVYEYFKGFDVYNRGIGGDTTKGLLKRLNASIFDLKPSQVFIQIGTNDFELLNAFAENVVENIENIIKEIHEFDHKIEIVVISLYPVNETLDKETVGKRNNSEIEKTNKLLKNINGATFIYVNDKLILKGRLSPLYTLKGLHLNQKGYEIVTSSIRPLMINSES